MPSLELFELVVEADEMEEERVFIEGILRLCCGQNLKGSWAWSYD
jgi:hypothetical protein